jgi:hypothetical protein
MRPKKLKQTLIGYTQPHWWKYFRFVQRFIYMKIPQDWKYLNVPTITDNQGRRIDMRSKKKIKVSITIEEL